MKATAEKEVPKIMDIDASLPQQENERVAGLQCPPRVTAAYKEISGYTLVKKALLAIPLTRRGGLLALVLLHCCFATLSLQTLGLSQHTLQGLSFPYRSYTALNEIRCSDSLLNVTFLYLLMAQFPAG